MAGSDIEFPSNGHTCSGYHAVPESGRGPGVVVIQEWWGLVPHIRSVCDRIALEGFVALAPDLYHGTTTTEPDEAGKAMMALEFPRAAKDMSGAVSWLLQCEYVSSNRIGAVGFCMGGGLALALASERPEIAACVPFYGAAPWPDAAPRPSQIRAHVVGHWGSKDDWNPKQKVDALEADLRNAGVHTEFFWYEGADHAFFNDDRPEVFDPDAARLAWDRTVALFRDELTPKDA